MSMKSAFAKLEKYEARYQRSLIRFGACLREKLADLARIDPTTQKKYVDWMAVEAIKHSQLHNQSVICSINGMFSAFDENVKWFHNNAQRLGDVYKFTLVQIDDARTEHCKHKEKDALGIKNLKTDEDYTVALKNGNVIVLQPLNYKASRSIGGNGIGTKFISPNNGLMINQMWCTTNDPGHFESHTDEKQRLFYIMDIKNNEKMAVHFKSFVCCERTHNVVTFYNAKDVAVVSWGDHDARKSKSADTLLDKLGLQEFVKTQRKLVAKIGEK